MNIVGWNIGTVSAWCRLNDTGSFLEWGETSNKYIHEIIAYLQREPSFIIGSTYSRDINRCCDCLSSIRQINMQWPQIVWVTVHQWKISNGMKVPAPYKTTSKIRMNAFYIAQYGYIKYNRERVKDARSNTSK